MARDGGEIDRRGLLRSIGVGAVGALVGAGLGQAAAQGGGTALQPGDGRAVVLLGPDGRPLPTFRAEDPGRVRQAGRGPARGYRQLTLEGSAARTLHRAAGFSGLWLQVERGEVRLRSDGQEASRTVGELIGAGFAERYDVASVSVIASGGRAVIQTWSE